MMLYDEIRNELKQKVINGKTQDEISKQAGISQSHLCHLKNGSRSIGGMTLDTLLKLFPNAQIHLYGDTITGTATSHFGPAVGNNFGGKVIANSNTEIDEIISAVMTSEVPDECKVKVFNIISKFKK